MCNDISQMLKDRVRDYQTPGKKYQLGSNERCDHCGKRQWIVGRNSAECGGCGNTLPLAHSPQVNGASLFVRGTGGNDAYTPPSFR